MAGSDPAFGRPPRGEDPDSWRCSWNHAIATLDPWVASILDRYPWVQTHFFWGYVEKVDKYTHGHVRSDDTDTFIFSDSYTRRRGVFYHRDDPGNKHITHLLAAGMPISFQIMPNVRSAGTGNVWVDGWKALNIQLAYDHPHMARVSPVVREMMGAPARAPRAPRLREVRVSE